MSISPALEALGGEGPFRLLLNSVLLECYTAVPAALHLVARFFGGAGYIPLRD